MKVTKEMIGAAHDICLKKGDFVLSADLLERIYLAMDALANHSETSGSLKEQLAAVKAENENLREDAERLDWWIKHPDAVICSGGAYGPYHVMLRYSNRTMPEANTPRAAIDAAMKGEK